MLTNTKTTNEAIVTVYSTPTCPYCVRVKEYLTARGVKYTEYDVSKDRQKAKEMIDASGQRGVPVLQINGRIIVGFDSRLIDDALSKKPLMKREDVIGNIAFDPFA